MNESNNTNITQSKEKVIDILSRKENWIQIQTNRHKKMIDKLTNYNATPLRRNNRFEVLSNLKEAEPVKKITPITSKNLQNNVAKDTVLIRSNKYTVHEN
jgi:hypothetical protein